MRCYEKLKTMLCGFERIAVAYSGGVDSTLLLRAACDAIGRGNVLAVTITSPLFAHCDLQDAYRGASALGVTHVVGEIDPLAISEVKSNSTLRCYFCKKAIFTEIFRIAGEYGISIVCDGSNQSDENAYRPGRRALAELCVRSPLRDCGICKDMVRDMLRELGMEEGEHPSNSCLATRVPYGVELTTALLTKIAQAEELLHQEGFSICRVRVQDDLARIEIPREDFTRFLQRIDLHKAVKQIGFSFVTLDVEGYRSGSFDTKEVIFHENAIF